MLFALGVPLLFQYEVRPARMESAERVFNTLEAMNVSQGDIVLLSFDFGPNSKAENETQAEALVEHLMRKRIPFATMSQYILAQPFLDGIPERVAQRLMKEQPDQRWSYGADWVNLGLRLNAAVTIQAIAETKDIGAYLKKDARGFKLTDLEIMKGVKTLRNITALIQITSLTGTFETFVQFLKSAEYRPQFFHGCTSITIPKAYIYLDAGQLSGLLEGIAGAAWYSTLLSERYPNRAPDSARQINTGLGVAHLLIVALIAFGNLSGVISWYKSRRRV